MVLFFECPEQEMERRLLKRGETSGRVDDNLTAIRKRFSVFRSTTMPVVEMFRERGQLAIVSCANSTNGVYAETKRVFEELFRKEQSNQ